MPSLISSIGCTLSKWSSTRTFFHPYPVVISHNQVFFAGKLAEVRSRVLAEEHEIAKNVDRVICANAAVPVFPAGAWSISSTEQKKGGRSARIMLECPKCKSAVK